MQSLLTKRKAKVRKKGSKNSMLTINSSFRGVCDMATSMGIVVFLKTSSAEVHGGDTEVRREKHVYESVKNS